MKSIFQNLTPGVYPNSAEYTFLPSPVAEKILFYPTWTGHYFCSPEYFIRRESFPTYQLLFVEKGKFTIEYRGKTSIAEEGEMFLMDLEEPHYYRALEDSEIFFYGFKGANSKEVVNHILSQGNGCVIRNKNARLVRNLLKNTMEYYEEHEVEGPYLASMRIYRLLMYLMDQRDAYRVTNSSPVEQAITYIGDHLDATITLEELARYVGLSSSYFSHIFKDEIGSSPRQYITDAKMNRAKFLLGQTEKTVSEIAYLLGYASGGSFTNLFTERVGCAPKMYRKLMRSQKQKR